MNQDHHNHGHHQDMGSSATTVMNHARHMMMPTQKNITSVHGGHGSHADMMMGMTMTFHGGVNEKILFDQWSTNSVGAFIGSWFVIFFVAVLYEGLKTVRDHLAKRDAYQHSTEENNRPSSFVRQHGQQNERTNNDNLIPSVRTENIRSKRARFLSGYHLVQTLLHILQMGISYLLMLIAMTFNTYLFLAVILGAGFGHLLFGWRRSSVIDYNEHCH